jgi:hypothetical protein
MNASGDPHNNAGRAKKKVNHTRCALVMTNEQTGKSPALCLRIGQVSRLLRALADLAFSLSNNRFPGATRQRARKIHFFGWRLVRRMESVLSSTRRNVPLLARNFSDKWRDSKATTSKLRGGIV